MNTITTTESIDQCFVSMQSGQIYRTVIGGTEKALIEKALERAQGNQVNAAKLLGLNRNTLRTKIRKFNIDTERFKK